MKLTVSKINIIISIPILIIVSLALLIFLPSSAKAVDPIKAEMYLGDYEIRKVKEEGVERYIYEEVKYVETGSGKVIKKRTSINNTWVSSYYHTNHQGSTSQVTNNEGGVDTEYTRGNLRYFPYGEQITNHNIDAQVVSDTYTGQKKDTESDLMFYNARLYNQKTGLFMQVDSVNDGLNRYMYVNGDPVNATDPSGNWCVKGFIGTTCSQESNANKLNEKYGVKITGDIHFLNDNMFYSMDKLLETYDRDNIQGIEINLYRSLLDGRLGYADTENNSVHVNMRYSSGFLKIDPSSRISRSDQSDESLDVRYSILEDEDRRKAYHRSMEWVLAHEIHHLYAYKKRDEHYTSKFEDIMYKEGQFAAWYNREDPIIYHMTRSQIQKDSGGQPLIEFNDYYNNAFGFSGNVLTKYAEVNSFEAFAEYAAFYRLARLSGVFPSGNYTHMNYPSSLNSLFKY